MRRLLISALALATLLAPTVVAAESAGPKAKGPALTFNPIVQEWNEDGSANPDTPRVGWSVLMRRNQKLNALAHIRGLRPGGVYTFWWIVVQDDGTFPDDIFVASGGGKVVGPNGRATVRMAAKLGQPGIEGFLVPFDELRDTRNSIVRIEIAYHGQAEDAGDELAVWLSDFWTGTACPDGGTPNPNPNQPHCPVYYAATHAP